ncbi:MAG: phosphoribosylglycinamide formyltransferase [Spirochaetales bacterium]|nr:phosphoribosylglycinamide formyltransferase [Spirochaetales bacterium]
MPKIAVFASGSGSNFQSLAEKISTSEHRVDCLICDRKNAYVLERAKTLGIDSFYFSYLNRQREDVEREIIATLKQRDIDLIVFAGFMRLVTPLFVDTFPNKIVNIHPALLPKHPGTHGIEDSYNSDDKEMGISIHYVDHGMDTGPIICQRSFDRKGLTIEEAETKIHQIENETYPEVVIELLDAIKSK